MGLEGHGISRALRVCWGRAPLLVAIRKQLVRYVRGGETTAHSLAETWNVRGLCAWRKALLVDFRPGAEGVPKPVRDFMFRFRIGLDAVDGDLAGAAVHTVLI